MDDDFSSADACRQSLQEKLARGGERLGRVTEGDRRFFDCHKHRNHQLRQAAQVEIELERAGMEPPSGTRWFTIVRQLRPGMRLRLIVPLPEATEPDLSERECELRLRLACEQLKPYPDCASPTRDWQTKNCNLQIGRGFREATEHVGIVSCDTDTVTLTL